MYYWLSRCCLQEEYWKRCTKDLLINTPSERPFQVLRRGILGLSPSIMHIFNKFTLAWDACQEFHSPTYRFRAELPPDRLDFNPEVAMTLMLFSGDPVIFIVDINSGFQNAVFVENKSADKLWGHFILYWYGIFKGYINKNGLDQESSWCQIG